MGVYRLKVEQRGTIVVEGVSSLEEAEEYIESCNPVDDVKWSGFLEAMQGGIELQKINIPDTMTVKEFAEKIEVLPAVIIKWLFLRGKVKQLDSEIGFDDMKEFADQYGFICEKDISVDEYAYYTFQVHEGEEIGHYRILDVKEKISDM